MDFEARWAEKMEQFSDDAPAIMFDDITIFWVEIRAFAKQFEAALDQIGIDPLQTVGVLARNRPGQAAAIMSAIASGRSISIIYTMQSPEGIARDRWDVAIELVNGTVLVACGAIRERVSQELARAVFDAVKLDLERRNADS